jgi:hypothetical protein
MFILNRWAVPGALVFSIFIFGSSKSRADFGFDFVGNRRVPLTLDSPEARLSLRFTCRQDIALYAASVFCLEAKQSPGYRLILEADAHGQPSGITLSCSSFVPAGKTWATLPMDGVSLRKGSVYHLVLQADINRGGIHKIQSCDKDHWASFVATDVENHFLPADSAMDPSQAVLMGKGKRLEDQGVQGVYALFGSGGAVSGNPFDDPGCRPIYKGEKGLLWQAEALHPHCGTNATAFKIRIKKQGQPGADLVYKIYRIDFLVHQTTMIVSGTAQTASRAPADWQWVHVPFPSKMQSFAPECTYFALGSESGQAAEEAPGCKDCYLLSDMGVSPVLAEAAVLTFDGGPHLSRAASSWEAKNWGDEFERDANIVLLADPCARQPIPEPPVFPTPAPLLEGNP